MFPSRKHSILHCARNHRVSPRRGWWVLERSHFCEARLPLFPVLAVMAYHPSTPTRASRYVPVTPPSVSTAPVPYTTGYTTDYNAPTSHGGWNAQSPPTDYATPIYSYTEHVAPYSVPISPTTSYLAPENSEFVAGACPSPLLISSWHNVP